MKIKTSKDLWVEGTMVGNAAIAFKAEFDRYKASRNNQYIVGMGQHKIQPMIDALMERLSIARLEGKQVPRWALACILHEAGVFGDPALEYAKGCALYMIEGAFDWKTAILKQDQAEDIEGY